MRIITHDVVIGHPKENARKMSSGCQNTAGLAVAFALKVQCQSKCVNQNVSIVLIVVRQVYVVFTV